MFKRYARMLAGRKFLHTFFSVSLMAFLAKMVIVGKELSIASRFGRRDELDAFLIAFLIPSFIISLLGNAMSSAFMPVFIRVRENEGRVAAGRLFTALSLLAIGLLVVITLLVFLTAPFFLPVIGSGFSAEKLALTVRLAVIILPFILLSGMASLYGAILNAEEAFALVVLTPMVTPLLMTASLWFLPGMGVYALAYAIPAGSLLEWLMAGAALRKKGFPMRLPLNGRALRESLSLKAGATGEAVRQFLPAVTGGVLTGSSLVVDQAMAGMLPAGSVAALSYGNKVIGFVSAILSTTIVTALTPYFSKKMADQSGTGLYKPMARTLSVVFLASFLLPVLVTIYNEPLVKLIFFRGSFKPEDVQTVAGIQGCLIWQIPFFITAIVLVRFIASMRLNWILAVVAGFNLLVNIVLNYILMKQMGIYGIALSTTLVQVGSLLLLVFFVYFSAKKKLWIQGT